MNYGVVALGIYRDPEVYNPPPPLSIVLTNPAQDTILYKSDQIFVLRPRYDPKNLHIPTANARSSAKLRLAGSAISNAASQPTSRRGEDGMREAGSLELPPLKQAAHYQDLAMAKAAARASKMAGYDGWDDTSLAEKSPVPEFGGS